MRTLIVLLGLALTVVMPLLAIAWLVNGRSVNKAQLLIKTAASGVVILTLYVAGVWAFSGYYLRYLYPVLFIAGAAYAWRRAREQDWFRPRRPRVWISATVGLLVTALFGYLLAGTVGAGRAPSSAVEVDFPFREGAFYIAHGGSTVRMNAHVGVRDLRLYRGQAWALDIVQLDRWGLRARGLYPGDLARYRIFGTPVHAPCDGTVASAVNDLPDRSPPLADEVNLPGNYVQIECEEGFFILLAHLRQGSVAVGEGDVVSAGDPLGTIGNSGNTSEPHLHIHAQAGPGGDYLLDAEPVPLIFRRHGWLKRNDVVRVKR